MNNNFYQDFIEFHTADSLYYMGYLFFSTAQKLKYLDLNFDVRSIAEPRVS